MDKNYIVYADDDLDDITMIQDSIKEYDQIKLLPASDGLDALQLIYRLISEDVKPCLVILDINMPGLNGKDTLLQMQSDRDLKNIPVVLFSTSINPDDKRFAWNHGVEFINKPRSFKELEQTTTKFIDKCNLQN